MGGGIAWDLVLTIALGVLLGFIFIMLVVELIKEPFLLLIVAIFALLLGVVGWYFVRPAVATYMQVTSENPDAHLAFLSVVAILSAPVVAIYWWQNHRKDGTRKLE